MRQRFVEGFRLGLDLRETKSRRRVLVTFRAKGSLLVPCHSPTKEMISKKLRRSDGWKCVVTSSILTELSF